MKPRNQLTRRGFLRGSAATAGTIAFPAIIPSGVLGQNAPSKRINIGAIGVGSRSNGVNIGGISTSLQKNDPQISCVVLDYFNIIID